MTGGRLFDGLTAAWRSLWGQSTGRVTVVVFAALTLVHVGELAPAAWRSLLSDNLALLVLPFMIALLVVRTRGLAPSEERWFWNLIGLGLAAWLGGSLLTWSSSIWTLSRWSYLAVDSAYILFFLSLFLASDQQPQLPDGWSSRDVLFPFSVASATVFIAVLFAYFVVVPWVLVPAEYALHLSSFNLYVTLDLLLTVRFALLFRATADSRWRRCFALLGAAMAAFAVGDLVEGLGWAGIAFVAVDSRVNLVWSIPPFLIATTIVTCTGRERTAAGDSDDAESSRVQSLLPVYAFALPLVHLGLSLMGQLNPEVRALREAIVFSGLLVFAVLSLGQQFGLENAVASLRSDLLLRALDDKLRQSQRMEAVGRLAGGVAHDLNNLLMVIKSTVTLAGQENAVTIRTRSRFAEIDRATDRAADLIRQLLAFGGRQVLKPEVVEVNDQIRGLEGMLARILGDDIELVAELDPGTGFTRVDPVLLEQVVVNLAVNARDAMPRGGRLTFRTRIASVMPRGSSPASSPEPFVVIEVTDTGVGIDSAIRDRIFEPYFTTKEMEKGTGLGLATVYGIVEQSGGFIEVESKSGKGSTFTVHLPRTEDPPFRQAEPVRRAARSVAGTTVLLTEDEESIRQAIAEYLESLDLEVLQASDGVDAIEVARSFDGRIDVLVTDLVMPRMNGPDLARRLLEQRRDLKVVYVSGYTPETMQHYGVSTDDAVFLQKPFLLGDLAGTIRDVMES